MPAGVAAYTPDGSRKGYSSSITPLRRNSSARRALENTSGRGRGSARDSPGDGGLARMNSRAKILEPEKIEKSLERPKKLQQQVLVDSHQSNNQEDVDDIILGDATPVHNRSLLLASIKDKHATTNLAGEETSRILKRMRELEEEHHEQRAIDSIATKRGISESMFLQWLDMLVLVFAFLSVQTLGNAYVQDVQTSIDSYIRENANFGFDPGDELGQKALRDVHSVSDVYSWLRLGFVPVVLADQHGHSEHHPQSSAIPSKSGPLHAEFLNWNHIVGPVRLSQSLFEAGNENECAKIPGNFEQFLTTNPNPAASGGTASSCAAEGGSSDVASSWARIGNVAVQTDLAVSRPAKSPDKSVFLPTGGTSSTASLQTLVADLEKNSWIQPNARTVQVSFLTLNREYALWTMTTVSFTFRRGGLVLKDIYQQSQWLNWYGHSRANENSLIALHVVWLTMNCYILLQELAEIHRIVHQVQSFRKFAGRYFTSLWNVVDWLTVITAGTLLGFYFQLWTFVGDLNARVHTLDDDELYSLTLDIMRHSGELVFCSYVYVLVSLFRLFKGFAAQPRLGVVTSTIVNAATDIMHFLVVFSSVFFAYAVAGVIVFGRHLREFSDLGMSIVTCWRLVLGDFDWTAAEHVAPWEATLFYFSFTLLVVLIMLNMLLAIVLDTYMDVKSQSTRAETLYSQGLETFSRYVRLHRRQRVSLDAIRSELLSLAAKRVDFSGGAEGGAEEQARTNKVASTSSVTTTNKMKIVDEEKPPQDESRGMNKDTSALAKAAKASPTTTRSTATASHHDEAGKTLVVADRDGVQQMHSGSTALEQVVADVDAQSINADVLDAHILEVHDLKEGTHSRAPAPRGGASAAAATTVVLSHDIPSMSAKRSQTGVVAKAILGNENNNPSSGSTGTASATTSSSSSSKNTKSCWSRSTGSSSNTPHPAHSLTEDICREHVDDSNFLTAEALLGFVPGLKEGQAARVVRNALADLTDEGELHKDPPLSCGFEALNETIENETKELSNRMSKLEETCDGIKNTLHHMLLCSSTSCSPNHSTARGPVVSTGATSSLVANLRQQWSPAPSEEPSFRPAQQQGEAGAVPPYFIGATTTLLESRLQQMEHQQVELQRTMTALPDLLLKTLLKTGGGGLSSGQAGSSDPALPWSITQSKSTNTTAASTAELQDRNNCVEKATAPQSPDEVVVETGTPRSFFFCSDTHAGSSSSAGVASRKLRSKESGTQLPPGSPVSPKGLLGSLYSLGSRTSEGGANGLS
ncbi:unnamed protein product [Amoebophrya sp. A25]|nr:unnamed protein product [Amoebophrya sp. A25]|eukprot:GSA25T00007272001.1